MTDSNDLHEFYLDVLGQQPLMKIYTQICFCYAVPENDLREQILDTLNAGLLKLSTSFPWIAGQVISDEPISGETFSFKIVPLEKTPRLVVRYFDDDNRVPNYQNLREANYPFRMLDESLIAPRNTLPGLPGSSNEDIAPVLLLQANFITGGLILTFAAHHSAMDMTGQGQIMTLLSKACHNEPFSPEDLASGNLDRRHAISFLENYTPGPEIQDQVPSPSPKTPAEIPKSETTPNDPPKLTWAYFSFPATSLSDIKKVASSTIASPAFISTDDALTALIWQSVTRIRQPRLKTNETCRFARAVDVRSALNISPTYTGFLQNMTFHSYPIQRLTSDPLGDVALNFRARLDPKELAFRTRALATFFKQADDKSIAIDFTAGMDLSKDIMLSSWVKPNCYELDFGLGLGTPESVRRPQFTTVESLFYLMPKRLDGEVSAALCLREEDLWRLKKDEEFMKYCQYVG
ncbi:trichothecene 3-O-acetyltransferase [Microthyrium microscopicum]|uniref:Trichothecene 3-O-acetyltransferase n=1 Tax=Microthyrium microscopicum TaxID=703497 RepID=A0A6A6UW45_9PEZI|nr:trichothecene 3-O-acetyltransferase [Microthyrium microscopicum]